MTPLDLMPKIHQHQWHVRRLGDLVEILDHLRIPVNSEERDKRLGNVPYYGANGIQGYIDKQLFNEPLVLLAEDGGNFDDFTSRSIAYRIDGPSWVNNHAHILRSSDANTILGFLFHALEHRDIRRYISGGTRGKLTQAELRAIEVLTPPTAEQARIAEVLDTLDEAIRETEAIICKLKAINLGLIHGLLTRGIDTNLELRPPQNEAPHLYKYSPVGWIPKEWNAHVLGDTIEHLIDFRGRTPKKLGMNWGGGNILALSANNVQPGAIDISREAYFGSESLYKRWMTSGDTRKSDVLLTLEAPLGNVAQIPDDSKYILSQRVIALRFKPTMVLNDFAFWQMRSHEFQRAMISRSTGSTATGIQRAELVRLYFKAPPVDEQKLINDRLFSLEQNLASESATLAKHHQMKVGLSSDLLTGCVRTGSH